MLFYVFFVYIFPCMTTALKNCDDCMPIVNCEAAQNRILNDKSYITEMLISNALCNTVDTHSDIKNICCSMFNNTDEIENHPQLKLLPASCGNIENGRIAVGTTVSLFEMPWMALIIIRSLVGLKFTCVGTLINSRYVLTAAHCVKFRDMAGVRVGEYDLARSNDCDRDQTNSSDCMQEDMRVSSVVYHNEYTVKKHKDIALIRLRRAVNFTKRNLGAVCLPITSNLRNYKLSKNVQAISAGWGLSNHFQQSNVLLKDVVPVYYGVDCQRFYNRSDLDIENQFCAGKIGVNCIGDSGGPLLIKNHPDVSNKFIQYGIQAYGMNKCGEIGPEVYTDVTKHITWILDTIRP